MKKVVNWFWELPIINGFAYFRHRTNWHKHPWISYLMCRLGRHDYEAYLWDGEDVWMECFYCLYRKRSGGCRDLNTKVH